MNSDHKAVIAGNKLSIVHKIQQIQRSTQKKAKKQRKSGDIQLDWNEHTISIYQVHQEQALNTTHFSTTTNLAATEELHEKLEHIMTNSASTTKNGRLQDNTNTNHELDESLQ